MQAGNLAIVWIGTLMVAFAGTAQAALPGPDVALLKQAEARLAEVYNTNKLWAKWFRAEWLPDSSGYIVTERVPESDESVRVLYRVPDGHRTVLSQGDERGQQPNDRVSPDGRHRIEFENGDLWVRTLADDSRRRLTESGVPNTVDTFYAVWSPDGTRIAFEESDQSGVRLRTRLIAGDPSYPETKETRFARAGGVIARHRVGVVTLASGEMQWLDVAGPEEDCYIRQVEWAGNSDEVLIEKFSRFRDQRSYLLANVNTGEITSIYEESDPAWVVASYQTNAGLEWIRDGQAFLLLSEKEGWRQAYLHARDGRLQAKLTPGAFDIIQRSHIDEAGNWFYFYASPDNATQKYLYRVSLDGSGTAERVTPADQPGTHSYDVSPDSKWAFHTYSRFDTPPVTTLIRLPEHEVVRTLEDNAALHEHMKRLIPQPTEFVQATIEGDITMDAWLMKPRNFDPARTYPVVVFVYGEPHAQTVRDAWQVAHSEYHWALAELGYLVVSIDNRGTPAPKGAAWRRAVFGSLGPLSTEEQAAALQALAGTRPYMDMERVGIWGWSGGGSNTLNAMFRKPDVYQVGIAVAPKPQPHLYNAWFQEIYMNSPEANPEGYRRAAAIHYAEGLQGDLLIIHGTGETNTHIQITEGLVDRLIELGKSFDYMAYPNRDHSIWRGPGTTLHLRMLMVRYLLDHLPPEPR